MQYDAKVIEEFATRLYARAKSVVVTHTLTGLVLGAIVGGAIGAAARQVGLDPGIAAIVGAVMFAASGYSMGTAKAFQLRLQAQTALCSVQIEKNTRPAVSPS